MAQQFEDPVVIDLSQDADDEYASLSAEDSSQPKGIIVQQRSPADFTTGLFECCAEPGGIALCAMGTFCSCFVDAKNGEQIGFTGGYWGAFFAGLIPFLKCFCICAHANETLKARNGGQPVGRDVCTCLETTFCACCTAMRTRREQIISLGKSAGYGPGADQAAAAMLRDGKKPVSYSALPQNAYTEDVV